MLDSLATTETNTQSAQSDRTASLLDKARAGERITFEEALFLYHHAPFLKLGEAAHHVTLKKNGDRVPYLIDGNINYTNVCNVVCKFCAFYRPQRHKEAWTLSQDELDQKIEKLISQGATQVLLQGGLHPDFHLDYYVKMIRHFHERFPNFHIHAFSPPEIVNIAKLSNCTYRDVLQALYDVGMRTMPGGGAEILVDRVRERIAIGKCTRDEWLNVMRDAHRVGIKTTSTMMFGHAETIEERIEHLDMLRRVQDETGGFLSFIPWTFQPEHTALHPEIKRNRDIKLASAHEYLKMLALSRLYLDNIDHIQVSCLTQGLKVGQLGLLFGSDDLGSVMLEELVVSSAGCDKDMTISGMLKAIAELKRPAYQRDTFYRDVNASAH